MSELSSDAPLDGPPIPTPTDWRARIAHLRAEALDFEPVQPEPEPKPTLPGAIPPPAADTETVLLARLAARRVLEARASQANVSSATQRPGQRPSPQGGGPVDLIV